MAFQEISKSAGKAIAATKMDIGSSVTGYFIRVDSSPSKFGGTQFNLKMQDPESGEQFTVFTGGTLKFVAEEGRLVANLLTRITRKEDEKKQNKAGKTYVTSTFKVEQDASDVLIGGPAPAALSDAEEALAKKIKGTKV